MLQENTKGTVDRKANQRLHITTARQHSRKWLLKSIMKQKLKFFGHTKRHNSLEREIYEGIIEGGGGEADQKGDGAKTSLI